MKETWKSQWFAGTWFGPVTSESGKGGDNCKRGIFRCLVIASGMTPLSAPYPMTTIAITNDHHQRSCPPASHSADAESRCTPGLRPRDNHDNDGYTARRRRGASSVAEPIVQTCQPSLVHRTNPHSRDTRRKAEGATRMYIASSMEVSRGTVRSGHRRAIRQGWCAVVSHHPDTTISSITIATAKSIPTLAVLSPVQHVASQYAVSIAADY
jgi:hypothetical protein